MGGGLSTPKTVVIIGGGHAGLLLAKKLDPAAKVIVIEKRDVSTDPPRLAYDVGCRCREGVGPETDSTDITL